MRGTLAEQADVLTRLISWGEGRRDIRALILTSSRARPYKEADALSDYDVIVVATDPKMLSKDDAWQLELGRPLVRWGDQGELAGLTTHFRGVFYEDAVKLDYTIWPNELLERVAHLEALPEDLDAGYRILLDKDGTTSRWDAPTYRAFIPSRPTAAEYRALVEEFWWDASYAAKSLWRDDLVFAKSFMFEHEMRLEVLCRLLEWRIQIDHDWSLPTGRWGRGLKRLLPSHIWSELEASYVGPGIEENWGALFRLTALFRRVAIEVGESLGYVYPRDVDEKMTAHIDEVRRMAHA